VLWETSALACRPRSTPAAPTSGCHRPPSATWRGHDTNGYSTIKDLIIFMRCLQTISIYMGAWQHKETPPIQIVAASWPLKAYFNFYFEVGYRKSCTTKENTDW
jgi:hypothetical protein